MNVAVLVISLVFVAVGCIAALNGRGSSGIWAATAFFGACLVVAAWDVVQKKLQRGDAMARCLERYDGTLPLVFKCWKTHFLAYSLGAALGALAGALMIMADEAPILGWILALCCGGGSAILFWQVIDPRPRLVIDSMGITDRTLHVGRIAWSDIDAAYIRSIEGVEFICLVVRDSELYLAGVSPIRRKLMRVNRLLGFTDLNLNLAGLAVRADEVLQLIRQRASVAQGRHEVHARTWQVSRWRGRARYR
jgi:hypothetical protein